MQSAGPRLLEHPQHRRRLKLDDGSLEIRLLEAWIAQGAKYKDDKAPALKSIRVSPERLVLQKGQSGPLVVTAVYADGSTRDVSADARCRVADARVASAVSSAAVAALDCGDTAVVVGYLRHFAVARVLVPCPQKPDYSSFRPSTRSTSASWTS